MSSSSSHIRLVLVAVMLTALTRTGTCAEPGFPEPGLTKFYAAGPPSFISAELEIEGQRFAVAKAARPAVLTIKRGRAVRLRDGRREIPAEIVDVFGHGYHEKIGDFFGRENPKLRSVGKIRSIKPGADFPAESYFEIYAVLVFPKVGLVVFNKEPFRIESVIDGIPPLRNSFRSAKRGQSVALYDQRRPTKAVGRLNDVHVYPTTALPIKVKDSDSSQQRSDSPETGQ